MKVRRNNDLPERLTAETGGQPSVNVESPNLDAFAKRMRELVGRMGSVAEVARKCGMAESTVKKWVDGVSDPSRGRCVALAQGPGVSLLWLVAGEGDIDAVAVTASQDLSAEHLTVALELADEALRGKRLPRNKYAQLVGLIYEGIMKGLPEADIVEFTRP